ncbi:MAG: SpoIID/LytB domain-containing protein [Deltaproteobacteria bacterium]|nr:SpoIID/LytB domain-containing protein [Deltaproteobacteria bacterium]
MDKTDWPVTEPQIAVGLLEGVDGAAFELFSAYRLQDTVLLPGRYSVCVEQDSVIVSASGKKIAAAESLELRPIENGPGSFVLDSIPIGKSFHWERLRSLRYQGELALGTFGGRELTVINRIPLERYLASVISSEMSSGCPAEFLKAHCVASRSWLLAQLQAKKEQARHTGSGREQWTDATKHHAFDVCADDHCQRYHGTEKVNATVDEALRRTRGEVLADGDEICDARFSKCCGGITERFATAWDDRDPAYLVPVIDAPEHRSCGFFPASEESVARSFIAAEPDVYCNVRDAALLERVLPDFDFETNDFFRWEVQISQEELGALLLKRAGLDIGRIKAMVPLARGASGRIYSLRVVGEKGERIFGKELEIRRVLSSSHLYSSAFIVEALPERGGVPEGFVLQGAGWGHGVGMCQIGAAAMAAGGRQYREILAHYFQGAQLHTLY